MRTLLAEYRKRDAPVILVRKKIMQNTLYMHRMALAVCGALALMAGQTRAQVFDVNSVAVRQAYVGEATQAKKDAALVGLTQLLTLPQCTSFCAPGNGGGVIVTSRNRIIGVDPSPLINTTIQAANDGDLGTPGSTVTLNNTLLRTLATFSTPRNFLIGSGGAVIDTNNFNLSITGTVTANGTLFKDGLGTLALTGNNVWNQKVKVLNGVLEGNTSSLQTSIINNATVRFNQTADGIYSGTLTHSSTSVFDTTHGDLEKNGAGKLTLTNAQAHEGTTSILGGTLALQGAGSLGTTKALSISGGATFDISGASTFIHEIGTLSGGGNITLGSNRITANSNLDSTFSGTMSGAGGLNKDGSGTLTLTGNNSFTGITGVSNGTLALVGPGRLSAASQVLLLNTASLDISGSSSSQAVGSILGSGAIRLGANTLTVGGDNSSTLFSGAITGSGGITKTGTGYLNLTGTNTYAGITTVNQGNLIAKTQSISDRVFNNAALTLTEEKGTTPFISAYSGTISGTGQLVKAGDGIIWLRGRNTYTGGTTVNEGILIGNTDSLQGNITNNAALAIYQVDNGTYAGTLSGSGTLLQYGPGVLTLTGNNTYTGGTAFSGTLRISSDANLGAASGELIVAGGTLKIGADVTTARNITLTSGGGSFDTDGHSLVATGSMTGVGGLTKTGSGTLALDRINSYSGATAVNAGRLEVNGSIASNVTVAAGAELGGTGQIVGSVINSGRLARGSGIGDVRVSRISFESSSLFTVKTDAAGNSDRLVLTSTPPPPGQGRPQFAANAILNGGTVEVLAQNGNYRRETLYNIVNTQDGVFGKFSSVTSNLAFLDPTLSYDLNNVFLTLKRNDLNYASVAQTPNQFAVAQGLTRISSVTTGDAATVTAALDGLSAAQARAAFDSIGAAGRALIPQSFTLNQRSVNQNLVARLGIADSGNSLAPTAGIGGRAMQLAFDESTRSDAAPVYAQLGLPSGQGFRSSAGSEGNNGLWLRGYGGSGRLDGDANAPGAKYSFGGTLFGYDRKIGNDATVGVFAGYAQPRYDQDLSTSSAHAKTTQLGAYGRLHSGNWRVDGVASYARNSTETSRVVTVGALNRVAKGSFNGDTVAVHVETGYTLKAGSFDVQPLAALSWVRQTQNAYSETGAGALNLVLPDQTQESLRSSLGARTLHPFQVGSMQWVFETRAAWSHEFKNARSVNARLAGDPVASVFTVSGPSLPRDSAVVGVGIAAQASRNLRLYADVNGEYSSRERAHTLSVGLRYQW